MHCYIGTSGWRYASWRQHFYRGIPERAWLAHASRVFNAIEINGSFYRQIAPKTYRRWYQETPPGFCFTLKGHRFITHYKRLRDAASSIALLRDPARALGDKLRAVVWQLPSNFSADHQRLDCFLRDLHRVWPDMRHAIEMRHRSWFDETVAEKLRRARVAVCIADAPDFPMWREVTADLVYVRLHGHTRKYASSYSREHLQRWANDARRWLDEGREVHVYFDNDAEGAAVKNARTLRALLNPTKGAPSAPRARRRASPATRARPDR